MPRGRHPGLSPDPFDADAPRTVTVRGASASPATPRISGAPRQATQLPRLDDPSEGRRVFNPVTGIAHPLAPPLIVRQEDGGVVAEIALGLAYEGPPTFVHGGMSALFMDQMLGSAAGAAGLWGMTAHLELEEINPEDGP